MISLTVNIDNLLERCRRDISREASRSYDTNGNSLYDDVRLTSLDNDPLTDDLKEALRLAATRLKGKSDVIDAKGINLNIPDFETNKTAVLQGMLERYLTLYAENKWLELVSASESTIKAYQQDTKAAFDNFAELASTRQIPKR